MNTKKQLTELRESWKVLSWDEMVRQIKLTLLCLITEKESQNQKEETNEREK